MPMYLTLAKMQEKNTLKASKSVNPPLGAPGLSGRRSRVRISPCQARPWRGGRRVEPGGGLADAILALSAGLRA